MPERTAEQVIENEDYFNPLVPAGVEVSYLHCLSLGWTEAEIEKILNINPDNMKWQLSDRMLKDDSFDRRVQRLPHMPFVAKGFLSPREGMVAFLAQAGFRQVEIAKTLGLDPANVRIYNRRIRKKEERRSDLDIPQAIHGGNVTRLVLSRALHSVIANNLIDTSILDNEPTSNLSYHESRALIYTCYGLGADEIALSEGVGIGTVRTTLRRTRKKLGVGNGRYTLIAKGIKEIVKLTS